MASVRSQILVSIKAAMEALSGVGLVSLDPLEESRIASVIGAGNSVIELVIGDDVALDPASNTEEFSFPVAVIVHMPADDEGSVTEKAGDWCVAVYGTYGTSGGGQWGGMAVQSTCTMFQSAVFLDQQRGTAAVIQEFEVHYGFVFGDPSTPR